MVIEVQRTLSIDVCLQKSGEEWPFVLQVFTNQAKIVNEKD